VLAIVTATPKHGQVLGERIDLLQGYPKTTSDGVTSLADKYKTLENQIVESNYVISLFSNFSLRNNINSNSIMLSMCFSIYLNNSVQ